MQMFHKNLYFCMESSINAHLKEWPSWALSEDIALKIQQKYKTGFQEIDFMFLLVLFVVYICACESTRCQ